MILEMQESIVEKHVDGRDYSQALLGQMKNLTFIRQR